VRKGLGDAKESNFERRLAVLAKMGLKAMKVPKSAVGIFLLGAAEMARLKYRFFKKKSKKSVDVLSFREPPHFPHPESRRKFLGEIYLNKELLKKDLKRLEFLLIHGLLHLLGYSHQRKSDILKMERAEEKLAKKLVQFRI